MILGCLLKWSGLRCLLKWFTTVPIILLVFYSCIVAFLMWLSKISWTELKTNGIVVGEWKDGFLSVWSSGQTIWPHFCDVYGLQSFQLFILISPMAFNGLYFWHGWYFCVFLLLGICLLSFRSYILCLGESLYGFASLDERVLRVSSNVFLEVLSQYGLHLAFWHVKVAINFLEFAHTARLALFWNRCEPEKDLDD